ncbi:hypothetical protein CAC42_6579 [Sphaceloma murrayae]|uniref:Uncharacterized protein n=1 Tax=Sphaceloma murrayae TaxID=2082308 RepID=A0A2K1QFV4_9PEZI|nr:hypothetical protein CAC42_6579 [Sphaceloma murrayae]
MAVMTSPPVTGNNSASLPVSPTTRSDITIDSYGEADLAFRIYDPELISADMKAYYRAKRALGLDYEVENEARACTNGVADPTDDVPTTYNARGDVLSAARAHRSPEDGFTEAKVRHFVQYRTEEVIQDSILVPAVALTFAPKRCDTLVGTAVSDDLVTYWSCQQDHEAITCVEGVKPDSVTDDRPDTPGYPFETTVSTTTDTRVRASRSSLAASSIPPAADPASDERQELIRFPDLDLVFARAARFNHESMQHRLDRLRWQTEMAVARRLVDKAAELHGGEGRGDRVGMAEWRRRWAGASVQVKGACADLLAGEARGEEGVRALRRMYGACGIGRGGSGGRRGHEE